PRAAGERRAGSARHREAVRRRRVKLGLAAAAVVAAAGIGGWFATQHGDSGDAKPGVHQSETSTPRPVR
ncbi:serine/threonine protein kinase, partial [Streptomyces rimosus]